MVFVLRRGSEFGNLVTLVCFDLNLCGLLKTSSLSLRKINKNFAVTDLQRQVRQVSRYLHFPGKQTSLRLEANNDLFNCCLSCKLLLLLLQ